MSHRESRTHFLEFGRGGEGATPGAFPWLSWLRSLHFPEAVLSQRFRSSDWPDRDDRDLDVGIKGGLYQGPARCLGGVYLAKQSLQLGQGVFAPLPPGRFRTIIFNRAERPWVADPLKYNSLPTEPPRYPLFCRAPASHLRRSLPKSRTHRNLTTRSHRLTRVIAQVPICVAHAVSDKYMDV